MTKLQARAPLAAAAPAPPPAPVTVGVAEERLVSLEQEVRRELGGVAARLDQADTRLAAAQEADTRTRAQLQELLSRPAPAPAQDTRATPPPPAPAPAPCPPPQEDVSELKMFVLQTVEAAKDLVRAPLSVVFDAVRSEDFIGEDNYLTFSKAMIQTSNTYFMTTNCRRTLTWATGWMWTAGGSRCRCRGSTCSCSTCTPRPGTPWCSHSGQWPQRSAMFCYFCLDAFFEYCEISLTPILVCIVTLAYSRLNDMSVLASCSGVGKASQSCVADLNSGDTVAVFVNDKTKLNDSDTHRYTHFSGVLLRPDNVRF